MLFTSSAFFYGYLPLVFVGYYLLGRYSPIWAASWLFVTSVAFYGRLLEVGARAYPVFTQTTRYSGSAANLWVSVEPCGSRFYGHAGGEVSLCWVSRHTTGSRFGR